MSKIVVVGANHAGTACINTMLDNFEMKMKLCFDQNSNISFLGCGMALWIGEQIDGPGGLFYSDKEKLEAKVQKSTWTLLFFQLTMTTKWLQGRVDGKNTKNLTKNWSLRLDQHQSFLQLKELKSFLVTANSKQLLKIFNSLNCTKTLKK